MKRFPLFILLLLMSFRLVASVAGVAFQGTGLTGKKAHYAARHGATETHWMLSESDPAEETEDSTKGFHPADVPALAAWVFAFGRTDRTPPVAAAAFSSRSPQPLFLLFQNFRI